jgi:hypothetical protein
MCPWGLQDTPIGTITKLLYERPRDFINNRVYTTTGQSQWPRPLGHWGCGFESHARHGCLCAFILFVLSCVGSGLASGWCPVRGDMQTLCRIKKLKKVAKVQRDLEPSRETENNRTEKQLTKITLAVCPLVICT